MKYEEIISRFRVKKTRDDSVQAICPAHDDKNASLTISRGENKTLLHCHAGCKCEDIVRAADLKMSDLFEEESVSDDKPEWIRYIERNTGKKLEDIYPYCDLSGEYAYTKIRLNPKDFRYGILSGDRFIFGLKDRQGKKIKRTDLAAFYTENYAELKKAIQEGRRIFYVEGEKDVKTLYQRGYISISCGSADDWIPKCASLLSGADVVILSDNDDSGRALSRKVYADVEKVAKSVKVITPTPGIDKGDVSDFFKNHSVEDFETLINQKPEINLDQFHKINGKGEITGVIDWNIFQYICDNYPLFVLGKTPYIYDHGVYIQDNQSTRLKTMIRDLIYPEKKNINIIDRIYKLILSDDSINVQYSSLNSYPAKWINFLNGLYDPVNKKLMPHDPKYKAINQIPYIFNPDDDPQDPEIDNWIQFVAPDDEDREMLLQFIGYCLTRDVAQQKMLFLKGLEGTGKSTVIRMISNIVGESNTSNVPLQRLASDRFAPYRLVGKTLNTCGDLGIKPIDDAAFMKNCLGDDGLEAEAKGKDSFSFKSYAKIIYSANELPIIKNERTKGFYRKVLILKMDRKPDDKGAYYEERLKEGIPRLIHMAVDAVGRMYKIGRILESHNSVDAVNEWWTDSDPVEGWLQAKTEKCPDGWEKKKTLFKSYEEYCKDMGIKEICSNRGFYRALKNKGYVDKRATSGTNKGEFGISGIAFKLIDDSVNNLDLPFH